MPRLGGVTVPVGSLPDYARSAARSSSVQVAERPTASQYSTHVSIDRSEAGEELANARGYYSASRGHTQTPSTTEVFGHVRWQPEDQHAILVGELQPALV